MRRARPEDARIDEFLARPDAGKRIEAVGERLAEDDDVRLDVEVLHRPHLSSAPKAHLDLVVDEQDAVLLADCSEALEVVLRRNDVSARALDRLGEQRAEFGAPGLRVPCAGVLVLEQPLELRDAMVLELLRLAAIR